MTIPPKITVVTACYNMVNYIEQTIKSITSQGYRNLEYIIIDGGSTDGTLDRVEKYSDKITRVISEPDEGQYHGIQKGMDLATGDILAWLNADDIYYPWTFSVVADVFEKFPDADWIVGLPSQINKSGQCVSMASGVSAYPREFIRNGWARSYLGPHIQQESVFWRKSLWDKVGELDLKWKLAADFELWTRFAEYSELVALTVPLAAFRQRPGEQVSSANRNAYQEEVRQICSTLKRPPRGWNYMARRSLVLRCICRLAIWKRCRVITYSDKKGEWVLTNLRRPISRSSVARLLLENKILKEEGH